MEEEPKLNKLGRKMNPNSLKNLNPAKPGETRNPNGSSRKRKLTSILEEALAEVAKGQTTKTNGEVIVETIIKECIRGNVVLIKEIFNRNDGAVVQAIEQNVTGNPLGVIILPPKVEDETDEQDVK